MEIPDLVRQELGDEEIQAGVNLGDEDAVCFTPTRTLVYRGEGLLSDEKVTAHPHDFERLTISEGRRKTKFTLYYTDEKRDFGVPNDRAGTILERLLEGKLRVSNGIDADESVTGVFRFSELTLVVTDTQLLKHLGNVTWDADYEAYLFEDVTGLDFEEGSVATAIVLSVNDRPERIKAPAEQAPMVRKTLQEALFAYHDVSSLADLNAKVGTEPEDGSDAGGGLGLESGIDPLVGDDEEADEDQSEQRSTQSAAAATQHQSSTADAEPATKSTVQPSSSTDRGGDVEALERQVAELTAAVERQTERIERQEQTIKTLIKELRQGR
ncbi:hypothetical protein NDI85_09825 [Halomicroarcula sp. S1AR25-4]|uniref:DUF7115 domain-containing protein n=1 Tax=Haloarcula sp. S1AR25-4 TaxID=2950538 RepID=UPI00287716E8|nr:hypothetical protein [Halomicroarcula sp. S1AR25-4]MDS0278092.1 hypothetical protein [Halomicroarcula sp. S1AR25-4]